MKTKEFIERIANLMDSPKPAETAARSSSSSNSYAKYSQTAHIFSNQFGFQPVLDVLQEQDSLKTPEKVNIAVVLGESNFLSSLSVLARHTDLVMMVDIDERVCLHNQYMLDCLLISEDLESYLEKILSTSNPLLQMQLQFDSFQAIKGSDNQVLQINSPLRMDSITLAHLIYSNMTMFGSKHFLDNPTMFMQCKEAASKLKFLILNIDLLNLPNMQALGRCIQENNGSIRVFNVTNLYDYDAPSALRELGGIKRSWQPNGHVYAALKALLDNPDNTHIIFAKMDEDKDYSVLKTCAARSLLEYQEHTQHYAAQFCEAKLPGFCAPSKTEPAILIKGMFFTGEVNYGRASSHSYQPTVILRLDQALKKISSDLNAVCYLRPQLTDLLDGVISVTPEHRSRLEHYFLKHHLNFRFQKIHGQPSYVILGINLPEQQVKILSLLTELEDLPHQDNPYNIPYTNQM